MGTYKIVTSAGVDWGTYEADSEADALDAMAEAAGYADQADCEEACGPFYGTVTKVSGGRVAADEMEGRSA